MSLKTAKHFLAKTIQNYYRSVIKLILSLTMVQQPCRGECAKICSIQHNLTPHTSQPSCHRLFRVIECARTICNRYISRSFVYNWSVVILLVAFWLVCKVGDFVWVSRFFCMETLWKVWIMFYLCDLCVFLNI